MEDHRLRVKTDRERYVIVDMDGTVAYMKHRNPYDKNVIDDIPVPVIIELVLDLYASGYGIIFVSGRKYATEKQTRQWIEHHILLEGEDYELFMRGDDDDRGDEFIKLDIWNQCIKDKFPVKFVLDDRNKVVRMWREQGLTCLQVADGDF